MVVDGAWEGSHGPFLFKEYRVVMRQGGEALELSCTTPRWQLPALHYTGNGLLRVGLMLGVI